MNTFLYFSSKAIKYFILAMCLSLFLSFEALGHGCQSNSYTPVDKTNTECQADDANPDCIQEIKHINIAS